MDVTQIFNYKSISDRLDTSGLLNEEQLSQLGAAGYQYVVNLLPDELDYAIEGERKIVESQGLAYTYIPVDFAAPTQQDFEAFRAAVASAGDKKLLVHCAANYRVSAFYAIYAHAQLGWDRQRCYDHIASIWTLAEHPQWQAFVDERITR